MVFIIAQVLGIIGMIISFLSYQNNSHKGILIFKSVSEGTFAVHYLLLNSYTGMAMNLIGVVRNILFTNLVLHKKSTLPYIFLFSIITIAFGVFSWIGWISMLPIVSKLLTTVAYGVKDPKLIRLLVLPSSVFWLIYNAYCYSIAGVLTEIFGIISIIAAMIRFSKKPKADEKTSDNDNFGSM